MTVAGQIAPPTPTAEQPRATLPPAPPVARLAQTAKLATRVAAAAFAGVLITAAVVAIAFTGEARGWLGYQFPAVCPSALRGRAGIFADNGRALLGVFGLLLIAQLAARAPNGPGHAQRTILAGGELILAGVVAANLLVVGAALGAYGGRMARAMLPHGPVELAAYATALALYLQGRRRALSAAHVAVVAAASVVLLALAACLETFVTV